MVVTNVLASGPKGAYEYHVRSYRSPEYDSITKTMKIPVHLDFDLNFENVELKSIHNGKFIFVGVQVSDDPLLSGKIRHIEMEMF